MSEIQSKTKIFFSDFGLYFFRVLTGGWMAIVFAHFFQVFFGFELSLLFFVVFLITGVLVRITRKWGVFSVIILNLFFVLIGVLFQMYIELALNRISHKFSSVIAKPIIVTSLFSQGPSTEFSIGVK